MQEMDGIRHTDGEIHSSANTQCKVPVEVELVEKHHI